MSRNLGQVNCTFCHGVVVLVEKPRAITRDDCGALYDERNGFAYKDAVVANAECDECCAKYLAWIDFTKCIGYGRHSYFAPSKDRAFFDLSYRSTFNDEPGPEDLPLFKIKVIRQSEPWPTCRTCGKRIFSCYGCQCEESIERAQIGASHGGQFRVIKIDPNGSGMDWDGHLGKIIERAKRCCRHCMVIFGFLGHHEIGPFVRGELEPIDDEAKKIHAEIEAALESAQGGAG